MDAILHGEKWKERRWEPKKSARRVFYVMGTSDEQQARAIEEHTDESYPSESMLVADYPSVTRTGPQSWELEYNYKQSDSQLEDKAGNIGVTEWEVDYEEHEEPIETDGNGTAIVNSAGDVFDPPMSRPFIDTVLRVYRYEDRYEVARALAYIGHVNDQDVTIPTFGPIAGGVVPAGTMLCQVYKPDETLRRVMNRRVKMVYQFRIRPDGWQSRCMDVGYRGFYTDSAGATKPGKFYDNGRAINSPILLDGGGKPLVSGYTVCGKTPVARPGGIPGLNVLKTQNACFLLYVKYPKVSFAGLTLF